MARETKEQREEREARERAEQEAARLSFLKTLPKRLKAIQDFAVTLGVYSEVALTESGPLVSFRSDDGQVSNELTYESEEWEVTWFEEVLQKRKETQEAARVRRKMAEDHYHSLSQELKEALKENIHLFR
jgi:hypothetical protein